MPDGVYSHVIGVDDAPFAREHRGDVRVVGTAYAGLRLEGILSARVRRDGANSARVVAAMIGGSRFASHTKLVMFQGIALAGFNVIDLRALREMLGIPVLVVARKPPRLAAIQAALLDRVPGGAKKWALIEQAGPMEPVAGLMVQREGITLAAAGEVVRRLAIHGVIPEPLRVAHLIAGGVTTGQSRGRA
ncbi:MAG: DUF99 family protein [Byssovorax sp.]